MFSLSDHSLRRIVIVAIALLVIYQVGTLIYATLGMAAGIVSAVLVAIVSFFSARMARAGGGRTAWFLVPTLLFTLLPLGAKIFASFTLSKSWWERAVDLAPFVVGFAAPVLLLLLVYVELKSRTLPKE